MSLRVLLLGVCLVVGGQAHAGLFTDDEAHNQIQQLETRLTQLVESNKQQTETSKQQTRSLLDLQAQIETLTAELRRLRGQNEELVHNLQDAEKRQKDFYVDLDTRLRRLETAAVAAPVEEDKPVITNVVATDDPALENRAYEKVYGLFKAGNFQNALPSFQEFLKKFPESVYVPNAYYAMGSAYFVLKDYKNALASYQTLVSKYSFSPKVADALFGIADCQQEMKDMLGATKTLKQIIAKYPGTELADNAKKRLALIK
ncbi:MAG: tol-pal system protein YbgF [Gallionellaceae bacterium]|nr:tol-pal system protein YbgF [Gallionellaceae bacterium]